MRLMRTLAHSFILFFLASSSWATHSIAQKQFVKSVKQQAPHLKKRVLRLAWRAYQHLQHQHLDSQHLITIIDYSMPSSKKRLWVINANNDHVLFHTLVAHGKQSGQLYAKHFSNKRHSHATSLGVFLTGHTYQGKHGYSLKLRGLEPHFNGNTFKRHVVIHSAWYVSQDLLHKQNRLGRSWGCPALSKKKEPQVVNTIKNGTMIFAYYPKKQWLNNSRYLQPVSA